MKEIQIDGRTLQFESFTDRWGDKKTIFYEGKESYEVKKYLLFGEKITKIRNKEIFRLDFDVSDLTNTKEMWRNLIRKNLDFLKRKEELDRGELI